ncbi:Slp family lipoprotein [Permianibacter aggregans]|uniref:Slp family outer membrane lipoprotein n=1 Tax=Permianibacter aggregans TaxID=1510150 RepID=A0A4R6UGW6_9GAMM|nr:Slp family lipoprotein [Permianibacter aggregans]QGX38448.1 hypothetical protein E2H98_01700 [Permianibacter aggregans]TDQ45562.1 Slp family outer membrane lipoprotein [Permianibacter aggregans]
MKWLLFSLSVVFLSACSTVPKSVRGDVREVTVSAVQSNAGEFQGVPVRWGGLIAQMQIKDGMSKIEIVEKPLTSSGRPTDKNVTGGRFIAVFSGYLDPMIFSTGREITVMGSIQEVIEGKVSDQAYAYPVLSASGYHLWEERDYYDRTSVIVTGGYWDPFYHPYWYRPYPYFYPRPVIIRDRHNPPNTTPTPSAGSQIPEPTKGPATRRWDDTHNLKDPARRPATQPEPPSKPEPAREEKQR